eukprot:TRINITY_DN2074_c0_g1_i1.p1 TRINITY_DN2074_c0_g1~~TRINITY_DN2074_c0_g1_i1.p1  ORF type:complete len:298 (-),score=87.21 TRINITY_DN2074_c0_g1_i1:217-1110(-)
MMVPMNIRCLACGEFIYKGKKFNAKKETVRGEEYLGIKIFRFYLKCTRCSSEITIKTDPKNSDYTCEMGATRNFEATKEGEKMMEEFKKKRKEEEEGNAMKALENRTVDNKMEMDILDGLDEIRSLNARVSKLDPLEVLEQIKDREKQIDIEYEADEEDLILEMIKKESHPSVKRLDDDNDTMDDKETQKMDEDNSQVNETTTASSQNGVFKAPVAPKNPLPKKKKPRSSGLIEVRAGNGKLSLKFQPKSRDTAVIRQSDPDHVQMNYNKSEQNAESESKVVTEDMEILSGLSLVDY